MQINYHEIEVETRGVPKYDTILNGNDSLFMFRDSIVMVRGWNTIKFYGRVIAPADVFFSLQPYNVRFIDTTDTVAVTGLPLKIKKGVAVGKKTIMKQVFYPIK